MNNIVDTFLKCKMARSFDDLAGCFGPSLARIVDENISKGGSDRIKCFRLAELCVRAQVRLTTGVDWRTMPTQQFGAFVAGIGAQFYGVLLAGECKKMYQIKDSAADFINAQGPGPDVEMTPEMLIDEFSCPIVMYSTDGKMLVEDVTGILMYYDPETKRITYVVSCERDGKYLGDVGGSLPLESVCSAFHKGRIELSLLSLDEESANLYKQVFENTGVEANGVIGKAMNFVISCLNLMKVRKSEEDQNSETLFEDVPLYKPFKNREKEREVRGYVSQRTISLTKETEKVFVRWKPNDRIVLKGSPADVHDGLVRKMTKVCGFWKMQPCGPGRRDRKPIYIWAHDAIRCMRPGLQITHVVA